MALPQCGSTPSFTLEQWDGVIDGLESLQEFNIFEETFRTDALRGNWSMRDIMPLKDKLRAKLAELQKSK